VIFNFQTKKKAIITTRNENVLSSMVHSFDLWLSTKKMKRVPHQTLQHGNCLYESIANCIQMWKGKPAELRLCKINWACLQVTKGTQWGGEMWKTFEDREGNSDNCGKHSFLEYLDFVADLNIHGTEYDIDMLCGYLNILVDVYTSSVLSNIGGESMCEPPIPFGGICDTNVILWHCKEHYEPIQFLSV
jgi:hypothetical protein